MQQGASSIDPAHLYLTTSGPGMKVTFHLPHPDPGIEGHRVIGYVYQGGDGGAEQRLGIFEAGVPTYLQPGLQTDVLDGSYTAPRTGTLRFHVASASGAGEEAEDRGVDIEVPFPFRIATAGGELDLAGLAESLEGDAGVMDMGAAFATNWRRMLEELEAQGQGNSATAALLRQQQAQMDQAMRETLQKQGIEGWETMSFAEGMAAPQKQARERLGQAAGQARATSQQQWDENELFRIPAAMLDSMVTILQGGGGEQGEAARSAWAQSEVRFAVGRVLGPDGDPVDRALVTLVEKSLFDQLRGATGVPLVRFGQWLSEGRYGVGITSETGRYLVHIVRPGEFMLIASAPHQVKVERAVTVTLENGYGELLPDITLNRAQGTTAAQGADSGFGQHSVTPGVAVEVEPRLVTWEEARPDGTVPVTVVLRPLGGFTGPVTLEVEGLSEGVEARLGGPVALTAAKQVAVTLKAGRVASPSARCILRATGTGVSGSAEFVVALGTGDLLGLGESVTVSPGGSVRVPLSYEGFGPAALLTLGRMPRGLTARLVELRSLANLDPVPLTELTVEGAQRAAEAARPLVPLIAEAPPRLIAVTPDELRRGCAEALTRGFRVGPGGQAVVELRAAADLRPGDFTIPITLRLGNGKPTVRELRVRVE